VLVTICALVIVFDNGHLFSTTERDVSIITLPVLRSICLTFDQKRQVSRSHLTKIRRWKIM
jgi:hypothetical protein